MKKFLFFPPFISCIILCSIAYAATVQKDLSEELLRLHIVANSNSITDQEAKLFVRDEIIKQVKDEFSFASDKEGLRVDLIKNTEKFEKIADEALKKSGLSYKSNAKIERILIPRKEYNNIILPEGEYDALVVRLGEAKGENWWCIVYPPLCFTESTFGNLSNDAKEYLKNTLSPESYNLISQEGFSIEYKLKLVEIFEKIKEKWFLKVFK